MVPRHANEPLWLACITQVIYYYHYYCVLYRERGSRLHWRWAKLHIFGQTSHCRYDDIRGQLVELASPSAMWPARGSTAIRSWPTGPRTIILGTKRSPTPTSNHQCSAMSLRIIASQDLLQDPWWIWAGWGWDLIPCPWWTFTQKIHAWNPVLTTACWPAGANGPIAEGNVWEFPQVSSATFQFYPYVPYKWAFFFFQSKNSLFFCSQLGLDIVIEGSFKRPRPLMGSAQRTSIKPNLAWPSHASTSKRSMEEMAGSFVSDLMELLWQVRRHW